MEIHMREFKKLEVWNRARTLTVAIYGLTDRFPTKERFRLVDQLCRAVVSIAANIAEGSSRRSQADFYRFLEIALGSANEVECHLIIASDLGYLQQSEFEARIEDVNRVRAMLINFMKNVNR
jgi:four helix bundle protein